MPFPPSWFFDFCQPEADRFLVLTSKLKALGVDFFPLQLGSYRHIHVPGPRPKHPSAGEKILLAHYDRFPGSPGANDNGSSVLHIIEYLAGARKKSAPLRVVFTDGEELRKDKNIHQGSYWLGKLWSEVSHLFPMVLDMTGIGDTFVLGHLNQEWKPRSQSLLHDLRQHRLWARRLLSACGCGDFVDQFTTS
jgi:Peptidase family M28